MFTNICHHRHRRCGHYFLHPKLSLSVGYTDTEGIKSSRITRGVWFVTENSSQS